MKRVLLNLPGHSRGKIVQLREAAEKIAHIFADEIAYIRTIGGTIKVTLNQGVDPHDFAKKIVKYTGYVQKRRD